MMDIYALPSDFESAGFSATFLLSWVQVNWKSPLYHMSLSEVWDGELVLNFLVGVKPPFIALVIKSWLMFLSPPVVNICFYLYLVAEQLGSGLRRLIISLKLFRGHFYMSRSKYGIVFFKFFLYWGLMLHCDRRCRAGSIPAVSQQLLALGDSRQG